MSIYHHPAAVNELTCELLDAQESFLYLWTLKPEAKDKALLTPELLEEFAALADMCEHFAEVYKYYQAKRERAEHL